MIDLSRLDCPVVSILRRAFGIERQQADKKEDTKGFSIPDASTHFEMPDDTYAQRYIKENW